jgi:hypothetical protein
LSLKTGVKQGCVLSIAVQYFHGLGGEEDEGDGREGN